MSRTCRLIRPDNPTHSSPAVRVEEMTIGVKIRCREVSNSSSFRKMMSVGLRTELKNFTSTSAPRSQSHRLIDISGVTPLPAPRNRSFRGILPGTSENLPFGPLTFTASPGLRLSAIQLDTRPLGTLFTEISRAKGRVGVEEME